MEEEEENYLDKQASEIAADILKQPVTPYIVGGAGLTAATKAKFDPKILGNMQTQVMKDAAKKKLGTTSLLANPKYLQYASNTLPTALNKMGGLKLLGKSTVPGTIATIGYDVVADEAKRTEQSIADMYDQSISPDATTRLANQLRKLNIIEISKAQNEGREPFGGEEGITMGNLDQYFEENPGFTGIGDVTVPGETKRGYVPPLPPADEMQSEDVPVPLMQKKDYETAFANEPSDVIVGGDTPIEVWTNYLGKLKEQGVSDDERTEIAAKMIGPFLNRQEVSPQFTSPMPVQGQRPQGQSPNRDIRVGGIQSLEEARTGVRPDFNQAIPDNPTGQLTRSDYRAILREQGIKGSAQIALAKQMEMEAAQGQQQQQLQSMKMIQDIIKARQPKEPRALTGSEQQLQIASRMTELQKKINAGQPLTDEEQSEYDTLNNLLAMQSNDPAYYESIFQQPSPESDGGDSNMVEMLDREGRRRRVKLEDVEKALKAGYTRL